MNVKKRWQTIKSVLHSTTSSVANSTLYFTCDVFANYFSAKICNICAHIAATVCTLTPPVVPPPSLPTFFHTLSPVSLSEVTSLLLSLRKSSPIDKIPVSLLKAHSSTFAVLLMNLANLSFSSGTFPSSYKSALITPILKKPGLDPLDLASFRPISNLRSFGKLLERLAQARLRPHITASSNFSPFQSAYRPNFSTETSSLFITNNLFSSSASGSPSIVASLDLSAAFDCVSHSILLDRLQSDFGITNLSLSWLKSYLSGRSQSVMCNGVLSSSFTVSLGVPQGSVLGPLLFTSYISPICRLINSFGLAHHAYADDTTLLISSDRLSSPGLLNDCTTSLSTWFLLNGLQLNPSKSEVIWIGTHPQLRSVSGTDLSISSVPIHPSSSIKLLGVIYDSHLSFNEHVSEICRVTNFHLRSLCHIRKYLNVSTANTIACAIIGSRLDYCNSILSGLSGANLLRLQRLQNRAARLVLNTNRLSPSEPALRQLHWLPVVKRIHYKVALLTFKTLSCGQPGYLHSLLQPLSSNRSLRSSNQHLLSVPMAKTSFHSRAFSVYAPLLWNNLPLSLRILASTDTSYTSPNFSSNLSLFKNGLKTFLFDSPLTSLVP